MQPEAFLCIDAGSQSLRASLIDRHGHCLARCVRQMPEPSAPQVGWAELDVDVFFDLFCDVVTQVAHEARGLATSIIAIGIACQRASVVNLDRAGTPLRPAILWSDQRRAKNVPHVGGLYGLGMRAIGVHNTVKHFQAEAEANWLLQHQPDLWARTHKFLFLSGYLNYRLTGEFVDSRANQVGFVPFSYRTQNWASAHQWHWRALRGIQRAQLPKLVTVGQILGKLTTEMSRTLNLPTAIPVVACATDKACETLGSGSIDNTTACLSLGTAASVNVTGPVYKEIERVVPAYPAAIPGHFLYETQTHRGFWLVSWFRREFAREETREAQALNVAPESLFDKFLQTTPPGADGLVAQPYWSPGIRTPGPEARGALIGFTADHTRAHIYRALVEGVIFSLREGLEKISGKTGQPIRTIKVAGGGARSDEIVALTANILGLPVERASDPEVTSLGVAMCCAMAMSTQPNPIATVTAMCHRTPAIEPDTASHAVYNALYRRVYRPLYAQLRPLYCELLTLRPMRPHQPNDVD